MPELYRNEINKLKPDLRKLYPPRPIGYFPVEGPTLEHLKDDNLELNRLPRISNQQLREMEHYYEVQKVDVWKLYGPLIMEEVKRGNHVGVEQYLAVLAYKRPGKTDIKN